MFKYFQTLPLTYYTLDEYKTRKIIPNIFVRSKFLSNVITNNSLFDLYNIRDGDTPEITANKFYGDTGLYWIILQSNDILDPRFGWPLDQFNLKKFAEGKYTNINAPHHYEDNGGNVVNATIILAGSTGNTFENFANNTVITNNTNVGTGIITSKTNSGAVTILTTSGGFISGDQIISVANTSATATISSIAITSGTSVTNLIFEDLENEKKRLIRILKRSLVPEIISEFEQIVNK